MDYFIEHIDYTDEALVEFVYNAYEKVRTQGGQYVRKQLQDDFVKMEKAEIKRERLEKNTINTPKEEDKVVQEHWEREEPIATERRGTEKKGLWLFKESRKRKAAPKEEYREKIRQKINGAPVQMPTAMVCEETVYEWENKAEEQEETILEEFGKTIYIEETAAMGKPGLYKPNGERITELSKSPFVIGKRKENADLVLKDYAASRVHARITEEEGVFYLEDLNSTNGTYKNGLRLQPYEKRKLESGDELKFAKTEFVYR